MVVLPVLARVTRVVAACTLSHANTSDVASPTESVSLMVVAIVMARLLEMVVLTRMSLADDPVVLRFR